MLKREDNELITRVGPGTPMGNLMREYWVPAMLSSELAQADSDPVRVMLLGEQLIGFRDSNGHVGLVANNCPHRGASLFFGRNEEAGLRCVYHGWKFDTSGACLDMPNEPAESDFRTKVKAVAYPCQERGGIVWTYMGPRHDPPPLPDLEANMAENATATAFQLEGNWLQILEGDIDTTHVGFLHYGGLSADDQPKGTFSEYQLRQKPAHFEVIDTPGGVAYGARRPGPPGEYYWRTAQFCMPFYTFTPPGVLGIKKNNGARVPMDDTHTMHLWYTAYVPPQGYKVAAHLLDKVYTYDVPYLDKNGDYILDNVDAQDMMAWITQGAIADRTQENLGASDNGIALFRRVLRREIKKVEQGVDPMYTFRDPAQNVRIDLPNEADKHHNSDGARSWIMRIHAAHSPIAEDVCQMYDANKPSPKSLRVVG